VRDSFSSHGEFVLSVRHDISKTNISVEHFKILKNPNDCLYKLGESSTHEIHGKLSFYLTSLYRLNNTYIS